MFSKNEYEYAVSQLSLIENGVLIFDEEQLLLLKRKIAAYDKKWANISNYKNKRNAREKSRIDR